MHITTIVLRYPALSYYEVSQFLLVDHFLFGSTITVAEVERPCPWGIDPVS